MSYGVGEIDSFGYRVGKAVKFVEVNVNRQMDRNERLEATTVAEIEVTKRNKFSLSSFFHFLIVLFSQTCSMELACFTVVASLI
jgi:hypothetical protein